MRRWRFLPVLLIALFAALWVFWPSGSPEPPAPAEHPPEPEAVVKRLGPEAPPAETPAGPREVLEAYAVVSEVLQQGIVSCALPPGVRSRRTTLGGLSRQWQANGRILGLAPTESGAGVIHGAEEPHVFTWSGATPGTTVDCTLIPAVEKVVQAPVTWEEWQDNAAFVRLQRNLDYVRGTCRAQEIQTAGARSLQGQLRVETFEQVPCVVRVDGVTLRVADGTITPALHFDASGAPTAPPDPERPDEPPFSDGLFEALERDDLTGPARSVLQALAEEEAAREREDARQRPYLESENRRMEDEFKARMNRRSRPIQ